MLARLSAASVPPTTTATRPRPGTRGTTPLRGLGLRLPKLRRSLQPATTLRRRQHLMHPPRHRGRLPEPWGARHHRRTPPSRHGMIYRHVSSYTDRHVSSYADTAPRSRARPPKPCRSARVRSAGAPPWSGTDRGTVRRPCVGLAAPGRRRPRLADLIQRVSQLRHLPSVQTRVSGVSLVLLGRTDRGYHWEPLAAMPLRPSREV